VFDQVKLEFGRDHRVQAHVGQRLTRGTQNVPRIEKMQTAVVLEQLQQDLRRRPCGPGYGRERARHRMSHDIRVAVFVAIANAIERLALRIHDTGTRAEINAGPEGFVKISDPDALATQHAVHVRRQDLEQLGVGRLFQKHRQLIVVSIARHASILSLIAAQAGIAPGNCGLDPVLFQYLVELPRLIRLGLLDDHIDLERLQ
jgi:hypothetical protein